MSADRSQLISDSPVIRALVFLTALCCSATAFASSHLTDKQLNPLKKHVGKTFWIAGDQEKGALFFSAPSANASSFQATPKESFQIAEMVGGANKKFYYKVRFDSGKEGYISLDSFMEELNLTVLTQDPDKEQKKKLAKEVREETKREAWIRTQSWPQHIKDAAIKRQAVLGMNMNETKVALGKPTQKVKINHSNPLMGSQEQWIYNDGTVLTFTNGVITRMQATEAKVNKAQ